jgi:hypothetical protein
MTAALRECWSGKKPAGDEAKAKTAGYEPGSDGYYVGRDPRRMTSVELEAMGHTRLSPIDAIRAKCLDCCGGSPSEVRLCVAVTCPNWPFRTGKNPWRAPPSEAQREAGRRLGARINSAAANPSNALEESNEDLSPATRHRIGRPTATNPSKILGGENDLGTG